MSEQMSLKGDASDLRPEYRDSHWLEIDGVIRVDIGAAGFVKPVLKETFLAMLFGSLIFPLSLLPPFICLSDDFRFDLIGVILLCLSVVCIPLGLAALFGPLFILLRGFMGHTRLVFVGKGVLIARRMGWIPLPMIHIDSIENVKSIPVAKHFPQKASQQVILLIKLAQEEPAPDLMTARNVLNRGVLPSIPRHVHLLLQYIQKAPVEVFGDILIVVFVGLFEFSSATPNMWLLACVMYGLSVLMTGITAPFQQRVKTGTLDVVWIGLIQSGVAFGFFLIGALSFGSEAGLMMGFGAMMLGFMTYGLGKRLSVSIPMSWPIELLTLPMITLTQSCIAFYLEDAFEDLGPFFMGSGLLIIFATIMPFRAWYYWSMKDTRPLEASTAWVTLFLFVLAATGIQLVEL